MKTKTINIHSFKELSEESKEKAINNFHDINTYYGWWDCVYENCVVIGKIIGIDINIIYFSGFSGQGDGACFEGSYQYKKGGLKALIDYAPQDEELHYIAKNLQSTQRKAFYQLTANVKHRGHYYHELCTYINIRDERDYHFLDDDLEEEIKDELRSFMQWIYGKLEKEYEWLTSKEAIIESIEANEYTFKSNGELENL